MKSDQKIKVAIIVPVVILSGGEKIAAELACEVNDNIYQVHLVVINERKDNVLQNKLDSANVQCHFYGHKEDNTIIRKIHQLKWIFNTLDQLNPDIIHVHLDCYFSWLYALIRKRRIIYTCHSQPYRVKNIWTWYVYRLLHKKDLIVSIILTKSQVKEFSKLFHVKSKELIVVPNFVEKEKFFYPERVYETKKEITFTFVARFHPIKNHHMLIRAFDQLIKSVPNCRLLLAGDGELIHAEKAFVRDLGIETKVDFLGEVIDIPDLLKKTDVCVISSNSESFSLALLEAMASGLPVVITNVGGMSDIVDNNGLIVPADDHLKFADAMRKLACNPELRMRYGQRSLELIKKYEVKNVVEQYKRVYMKEFRKRSKYGK